MPDDLPQDQRSGSVAHTFGNLLARKWAPTLPRTLTGGFLTLLYSMRTLASASGELRYTRDRQGITITEITEACRSDQKDVRTYLTAAIAAGVVGVVGQRRRGVATVYSLVVNPSPNWAAAAAVVRAAQLDKAEKRAQRAARSAAEPEPQHDVPAADQQPVSSGHRAPMASSGGRAPNFERGSSGDSAPAGFGGQCPDGFGGQCPDHPGSTHVLPHEMADVVPQPQDVRGHEDESPAHDDGPAPPPLLHTVPDAPSGRHRGRPRDVPDGHQAPLLLAVRGAPDEDQEHTTGITPAQLDSLRAAAEADPTLIIQAVARLGPRGAVEVYGWKAVAPHLNSHPQTG